MKIALSAISKFHTFDLARELHAKGVLAGIMTGYPRFKLRDENIPQELIHTFPLIHTAYMAFPWKHRLSQSWLNEWKNFDEVSFGYYAAQKLPSCDVYVGVSGSALLAGKKAHRNGAKFVCDRGSSHIRFQDNILRDEGERWGVPFSAIDYRTIIREGAEYDGADRVTVPSTFALRTFLEFGVPGEKLRLLPYGVSLSQFKPVAQPDEKRFDVLFVGAMSLRKGVQYLVQAYQKLEHPSKSLTLAGTSSPSLIALLHQRGLWPEDAKVLGHVDQSKLKQLMSRCHVLVLPSVEDGFGLVMAQAMACGCPVIASSNTGVEDLFDDGQAGYIVPIRDVGALADRLQALADNPELREIMSQRAMVRVGNMGGWQKYGELAMSIYRELLK